MQICNDPYVKNHVAELRKVGYIEISKNPSSVHPVFRTIDVGVESGLPAGRRVRRLPP